MTTHDRTRASRRSFLELARRIEEILVAVLASSAAVVLSVLFYAALASAFNAPSDRARQFSFIALLVIAPVAGWCVQIAWRLFARRERAGGGILSPTVLVLAGLACMVIAAYVLELWGVAALGRALMFVSAAFGAFGLATQRLRRARRRDRT